MKLEKIVIRGVIFGSLESGTLDIHIGYGYGINDGGGLRKIKTELVPINCRIPNTYVWVELQNGTVLTIRKMSFEEYQKNKRE